jgi:hypothetical protein
MRKVILAMITLVAIFCVTSTAQATLMGSPGAPSANGVQPIWLGGNPRIDDYCPSCDWYTQKIDPVVDGTYGPFTIDWYDTDNGPLFDWTSTSFIYAVLVKGGPNANLYEYSPGGETNDNGLHAPVNLKNGKYFGLSHISYCAGSPVPEPGTMLLLGTGLVGLAGQRIRKKIKK